MKVTFVANFMNHHQLPFSKKMAKLTGNNYTFIALEPIPIEQLNLGYEDMNDMDFVLRAYESDGIYQVAKNKILSDDIVIFGSCPNSLIDLRLEQNKLSILYTERFFKKGTYRRFIPITYYKIYDRILKHKNKNIKIICSSAFAPYDFKLLGYKRKILKWGYFPKLIKYDVDTLIERKRNPKIKILWVGRFIKLKHPETAIEAVKMLVSTGVDVEFNIIGKGNLENKIKKLVSDYSMDSYTNFLGSMSPDEVRKYMENSNIFLFTSDFNEGWGAVLNEAMNSCCSVVVSHAIGSVPFLVKDGVNGFIYQNGNVKHLFEKLQLLALDRKLSEKLGKNAYYTLNNLWNSEVATERLYKYLNSWFNNSDETIYDSGPCSRAEVITHKWFERG